MVIVRDKREQRPYDFLSCGCDITVEDGTLDTADYSVKHFENSVAVERKELSDIVNCLGNDRQRFLREMQRARRLDAFCVVLEGAWTDIVHGRYRSKLSPSSAMATIAALSSRLGITFHFAGTREAGEQYTALFLRQWLKGKQKEMDGIKAALADNQIKSR